MSGRVRQLALVVSGALVTGLLGAQVPAVAAASATVATARDQVNVAAQKPGRARGDGSAEPTATKALTPVWPKKARARLDLSAVPVGSALPVAPEGAADPTKAAAVRVGPAPRGEARIKSEAVQVPADSPSDVDVEVLDRAALAPVGAAGLGVKVTRRDGEAEAGPVEVTLDYSDFKYAYGGSFASRLRLVKLPACALTTPEAKGCSAGSTDFVKATNDVESGTLTATVQADADPAATAPPVLDQDLSGLRSGQTLQASAAVASGTVYALASSSSSDAGDYRASTLSPAGTWNVSTGSGAFTYNLPIQVPEPPTGDAPGLALSYNSQSVDAMTSSENTQASWSGLGWNLGIGFIERRYRGCQDDGTGTGWVGDLCWDSPNSAKEIDGAVYVISLNGVTSELIQDNGGTGWYHVKDDPGWRVQHLTGGHGSDDEYWVVSSQEGMRYYFGWGRSERTGGATSSVLTVPVFGNDAGEPGYSGGVGVQTQAYRWGLDRVVDAQEVESAYFYEKETNHYRSVLLGDKARSYDSAAYPVRIEYGWASQIPGAQLPAKVDLSYVGRCVERMADKDPLASEPAACPGISTHAASYPDVPTDLMCDGTSADDGCRTITGETYSPTFFATRMLWDIKTYVRDNDSAAWDPAMQYQMKYGLPNPEGTVDSTLWLDYIQRKGYGDGDDITLPTININGEWRDNQLGGGVLNFRRVTQIHGDLGSFTDVTYRNYDEQDRCDIDSLPSESNNTQACFRQKWTPEGATEAKTGWFKKYVVSKVSVDPGPGAGAANDGDPVMTTTYDYVGKPAWAFPNDPLTKDEDESWTDWRGYQQVEVHTGTKDNAASVYHWLYRGMDGDRTSKTDPSATRSVTVSDGDNATSSVTDHAWLSGRELETSLRDGSGQSHQRVWHEYWTHNTAQYDGLPDARFVRESKTTTHELTSTGWREHIVKNEFDDAEPASTKYGLPMRTNDWGLTDTDDNRCVTYGRAYNTDLFTDSAVQRWMVMTDETRHYAADCAARGTANADAYEVTLYDGATSVDTNKPVDGNITASRRYTDSTHYRQTTFGYDAAGRMTSSTDGKQQTTTTVYSPATSWPVDGVRTTVPDPDGTGPSTASSSTTWYSRLWGTPYRILDANGRTTRVVSDSVGRTHQVFKPSQIGAYPDGTPSLQFDYAVTTQDNSEGVPDLVAGTPPKITTRTLQTGSTVATSHSFTDGLGRVRETQTPAATGTGRTVVSTRYDTSGNVTGTSAPFYNTGTAGSGMVLPTVDSLPSYTDLVVDYAGHTTQTRLMTKGSPQIQNQASTNYHGDYTTAVPPVGARTNTYTNVFGEITRIVEFGPSTYSTLYEYTRSGDLAKVTDAKGNITRYTYNWLGERLSTTDPDAGTSSVTYDENGNVATVTDANNVTLTHTYDRLDRPVTIQNGATLLSSRTYDSVPGGIGLQASATAYSGGFGYRTDVTGYDVNGQPTGTQVVIPADGSGLEGTYAASYEYDAAGRQSSISYPATAGLPAEKVTSTYDAFGLPEKVLSPLATYVDATDFDNIGRLVGRSYGTAATTPTTARRTYTYDDVTGTGWLKNISTTTSSKGIVQNDDYLRDAGGQLTDLTDRLTSQRQCYTYDELNRLSKAWTSASAAGCGGPFSPDLATGTDPYQLDYTYDGIGNLQKVTSTTAAGSTARDYVYPGYSADQQTYTPGAARPHAVAGVKSPAGTDTYAYDNAGQMTSRTVGGVTTGFVWNELHHLAGTTGADAGSYVYDAEGNLLLRRSKDGNTLYLGSQEVRKAGSTAARGTRYYAGGTSAVAMRVAGTGDGTVTWLMSDQQASTQVAVDVATGAAVRRRYLPFGAQRGSSGLPAGTDRGFLGKSEDSVLGISILGARLYDANLGRFLSADPVSTPYDPQNMSAYSYARNNPVGLSDPSGMALPECLTGEIKCQGGLPVSSGGKAPAPAAPSIKYDKGFRADIVHDSHGNKYRIGEEPGITRDEIDVRNYMNDRERQQGTFSDGKDGGSGTEYRPVNPIKGQKRGNGTSDLVRLTWKDGKLIKVDSVDIYTPLEGKNGPAPILKSVGKKVGQTDEVIVYYKEGTAAAADKIGKALPSDLKLNDVHIVAEDGKYFRSFGGAGSALGPPETPSTPRPSVDPPKTGGTRAPMGGKMMRGAGILGELFLWYDAYKVAKGDDVCPWPMECASPEIL
ncbi:RHS repeat-associated core domain-containing protein [Streptomyces sp. NPDC005773]|uniref:RHS repeat-associated core domain-containing protein n=1 Tax=Streptomyces sp. NPDC005773 TaxID=3364727 RepID=UPI0036B2975D